MHLKRAIQKTAGRTGDLIGNKFANAITRSFQGNVPYNAKDIEFYDGKLIEIPKEKHTSPEKRQQIIDELKLV